MRKSTWLSIGIVLFSGAFVAGQPQEQTTAKTPYEVVDQMTKVLQQMNKVLSKVMDEKSAVEARPSLKQLVEQFTKLRQAAAKMAQPNLESRERIVKQFQATLAKEVRQLRDEVTRISAIQGGAETIRELEAMLKNGKKPAQKDPAK